ncbi:hypothetical protein [Pontiella agarivorans]|uniref:Lipase modulator n=1 Tax=Pontiella agarivorans TaxID=3038953 RepID=A0ABU5MY27_9BACT|nr:hypothetical protein [Pontiella agarivorans]MDZ8119088.1 hypothetical protein [Pontiella agarivorans]
MRKTLFASIILNVVLLVWMVRYDRGVPASSHTNGAEQKADDEHASVSEVRPHSLVSTEVDIREAGGSEQETQPFPPAETVEQSSHSVLSNITERLTRPGVNREVWNQQRIVLTHKYEGLIRDLGLSDDDADYFLDLLTARQMLFTDLAMKQMTGVLTSEEQQLLWTKTMEAALPLNEEINQLLGTEENQNRMAWHDQTEMERNAAKRVSEKCDRMGMPLNEAAERELVTIIMDEQGKTSMASGFNGDFAQLSDDDISRHVSEMEALEPSVLERASLMLTPEQLELFQKQYAEYVQNQADWFRMMKQMN